MEKRTASLGKRQLGALATKKKIFRAAIRLFMKKGYSNVTIDDIVQEAKVAKGSFYNHFASKEQLIFGVYDDYDARYRAAYEIAMALAAGNALREFFASYFGSITKKDVQILRTMYCSQIYAVNRRDISQPSRPFYGYVRDLVERGKQEGYIRPEIDNEKLLVQLTNYMIGVEYSWSLNDGSYSILDEALGEFDLLFYGLRP